MTDRAMQTLYKFALEPLAETLADPNSYGFRIGRSTHDAIGQCFNDLCRAGSPQWILEGDIKGCFDHISHSWLMKNIPMDKEMLEKWLKCGFVETRKIFPTEEGTPQGGTISPVLMNMTLDGLERILKERFPMRRTVAGKTIYDQINFVRYADDFIVTGKSPETLRNEVMPLIKDFLAERGLQLSEEKTVITHISDGFDFLGQNIRKYNGKLLIKPSKNAVKAFLKKVRTIVKENKTATQDLLIRKLNPVIRGWVNYHRYVVSADIFGLVDHRIFECYGSGLAADTNEKVGNGLPTNIGTILITGRGRLQQSLLSAVKISMKNTSSWNTRQILKSSDSRKSPPKQPIR